MSTAMQLAFSVPLPSCRHAAAPPLGPVVKSFRTEGGTLQRWSHSALVCFPASMSFTHENAGPQRENCLHRFQIERVAQQT